MADFCTQCSIEIFHEDMGDMANISTKEDTENEMYAVVLCEGCGPTQVDHLGNCISDDCLEKHGLKKN